ncbi:DEAD/DEAH box helicase [Georgenia sp. Z1344]|uniref:DEAD/DEAH box helicase n=1 Tax=Georgenia sp. Z1344 TaxID=3416706 RepID=UPI003CF482C7
MTTPAERYAASRRRPAGTDPELELDEFRAGLSFSLDPFQVEGCRAVASDRSVLVAAPTGAGKTVVGEFAVHLALQRGQKAFYTTPIKALSNQKFTELRERYGAGRVGLLTGDTSIDGDADVVVMTTEVLRNMLYSGSPALRNLGFVVMDEVHYLADRFRGPVWEEVILHLDERVRIVSLSATVSNAEEFGHWLTEVRGDTAVVVSERRPVPLWQHLMVGRRIHDLYSHDVDPTDVGADPPLSPELLEAIRRVSRSTRGHHGRPQPRSRPRGRKRGNEGRRDDARAVRRPARADVVQALEAQALLPAIVFIFSRAGCEDAVRQTVGSGVRLTTAQEAAEIRRHHEAATAALPPADLGVLGYDRWAHALEQGVAAHHAGMLPVFKEVVEDLFAAGLVKVVYATETLALGINMPARSVVVERLDKWDGSAHTALTPGEYTQLTGRAGRRGIDVEGHAVVLYADGVDPAHVAGLASRRTYPLRSAFRPTYNMAVNLLQRLDLTSARHVLEQSFAQFQADRSAVGLAKQVRRHERSVAELAEQMTCHLGDFAGYQELRERLAGVEGQESKARSAARRRETEASFLAVRRGDVVAFGRGRRTEHAVVLEAAESAMDRAGIQVLGDDRRVRRLTATEVPHGLEVVSKVQIPRRFNPRNATERRDLGSSLRNALAQGTRPRADAPRPVDDEDAAAGAGHGAGRGAHGGAGRGAHGDAGRGTGSGEQGARAGGPRAEAEALRAALRDHPCHGCSDRENHARVARRWSRAKSELAELTGRIEQRTGSVAQDLVRVCDVLGELGYLDGGSVTEDGRWLARIYAERDLLLAECLRSGDWDGLAPAELAAVASMVVSSNRTADLAAAGAGRPSGALGEAVRRTHRHAARLADLERGHRLPPTEPVDDALVRAVLEWAQGGYLVDVLDIAGIGAGDLVRQCKQLLDVLDQVASAAPSPELAHAAWEAVGLVRRGVVAWSSV